LSNQIGSVIFIITVIRTGTYCTYTTTQFHIPPHTLIHTTHPRTLQHILNLAFTNRQDLIKKLNVVDGIADHRTVIIDVNISS